MVRWFQRCLKFRSAGLRGIELITVIRRRGFSMDRLDELSGLFVSRLGWFPWKSGVYYESSSHTPQIVAWDSWIRH